jgi:phosphomannomutase
VLSKSGSAFIKRVMRDCDGAYGGEMSAHHYFRDFAYADRLQDPLVEAHYKTQARTVDCTESLSMEFDKWRFNLQGPNTEPPVRLKVENAGGFGADARQDAGIAGPDGCLSCNLDDRRSGAR